MTRRANLTTLALTLVAAAFAGIWQVGTLRQWDWQAAYLAALAWAFVFWNSARILTYLPTLRLLLKPGASAEHYSVATWASWVLSNAMLALYLFETGGRAMNSLVTLNADNALMCFVTCTLVVRLRWRDGSSGEPSPQGDLGVARRPGHTPSPARGVRAMRAGQRQPRFIAGDCGLSTAADATRPVSIATANAFAVCRQSFGPGRGTAKRTQ